MRYKIFSVLFTCFSLISYWGNTQEKKPLDVKALKQWKNLEHLQLSNNGEVFSYEKMPQVGQGVLYYGNAEVGFMDSVKRGTKAQLGPSGEYVLFTLPPHQEVVDSIKLAKQNKEKGAKKAEMPEDSLGLYFFTEDTIRKLPDLVSYQAPKDSGNYFLIHVKNSPYPLPKKESKEKPWWQFWGKEQTPPKKHTPTAKSLLIGSCVSQNFQEVRNVKTAALSHGAGAISYIQANTDTLDSLTLKVFPPHQSKDSALEIWRGHGWIKHLTFDKLGKQLAFLHSADTNKEKQYDLYYWNPKMDVAQLMVSGNHEVFPATYSLSEHGELHFSESGDKLFFGYGKQPTPDQKDTILADQKAQLDLWSYTDRRLQTMQLNSLKQDRMKNYQAVFHVKDRQPILLADSAMDYLQLIQKGDADIAIGVDDNAYKKKVSWEWPPYRDWYRVDVNTGKRTLVLKESQYPAVPSPNGKFIAFYMPNDERWHIVPTSKTFDGDLESVSVPLEVKDKEHDTPMEAYPYPWEGWSEDDAFFVVRDEFDLYLISSENPKEVIPFTRGMGKEKNIRFNLINLDTEEEGINLNNYQLLIGFDETTKESRVYRLLKGSKPEVVFEEPNHTIQIRQVARFSKKILWSMMNFENYPDLFYSSPSFSNYHRVSFTNPQQEKYKWGTVELTKWQIPGGDTLEGLVFKPEDFDPDKKYPTMVYFYERYSDLLHRYYSPRLSASIINPTHYVSNGYVVFIPDIVYRDGHPGMSAVECVVSGTQHLIEKGFVDEQKIGIQGQSWGGYQTAFIITQTNMFAAAMAGAPVSNMTSAYGGIRWGSGYSRMFQYEESQSRIGKTLWEAPELYIENSPIFHIDKVETPLLIMHNDEDGAVPWYQGIELFVGMRRLNKPAWMLTYNGDKHNLRKWPNKIDLTIRMKQFFDHYLMEAPKPEWMEYGIPALKKGEEYRYDLLME